MFFIRKIHARGFARTLPNFTDLIVPQPGGNTSFMRHGPGQQILGSRAGTKQDFRGPQSTPSTRFGDNGVGVLLYIGIINVNTYRLFRNYYVSRDKKGTEIKKLLVVLGCGLILLGLGYSQQATIAKRLLAAALPEQVGTNQVEVLQDGLHVALCGAGDCLTPLTVYGPEGVEGVIAGFNAAYTADFGYRHDHHGDLVVPLSASGSSDVPFATPPDGELATIFSL